MIRCFEEPFQACLILPVCAMQRCLNRAFVVGKKMSVYITFILQKSPTAKRHEFRDRLASFFLTSDVILKLSADMASKPGAKIIDKNDKTV